MRIVKGVQDEYSFALSQGVFAKVFGFAALFGVGDEEAVGEGGDMGVAFNCEICGGIMDGVVFRFRYLCLKY